MSAAAAPTVDAGVAVPVKRGKKKLIIIAAAVVLLLAIIGAGTAVFLKKRAAHAAEAGDDTSAQADDAQHAKPDLKHPPTFLPIDPFVVNLADKDADRYAQVGLTFEVADAHFAEEMKAFMPAIRNGILMILSHKSSAELLDRSGKELLAAEILREASRTMGIEVEEPQPAVAKKAESDADKGGGDDPEPVAKKSAKKAAPAEPNPIRHVHFSNFIVQ
jgi:flagellar protein FliL